MTFDGIRNAVRKIDREARLARHAERNVQYSQPNRAFPPEDNSAADLQVFPILVDFVQRHHMWLLNELHDRDFSFHLRKKQPD